MSSTMVGTGTLLDSKLPAGKEGGVSFTLSDDFSVSGVGGMTESNDGSWAVADAIVT